MDSPRPWARSVVSRPDATAIRHGTHHLSYDELSRRAAAIERLLDPALRERLLKEGRALGFQYVALDLARVVEALDRLEPVERFVDAVRAIAEESGAP